MLFSAGQRFIGSAGGGSNHSCLMKLACCLKCVKSGNEGHVPIQELHGVSLTCSYHPHCSDTRVGPGSDELAVISVKLHAARMHSHLETSV